MKLFYTYNEMLAERSEKEERRKTRSELLDRISKEQKNLVGVADTQFKNQAEGIKALADAEKSLAEIDFKEKSIKVAKRRNFFDHLLGMIKIGVSGFLIWTVYGLENNSGWFNSNKESGRMASDSFRDSINR